MSNKVSVNYNPKWLGLLGVIFVVAKVFEIGPVALWSWWLVLLPFYLGLAIVLGVLLFGAVAAGGLMGTIHLIEKYQASKRRKELAKQKTWDAISKK
jgi:hypothetical protein